jgi:hypothetical protein
MKRQLYAVFESISNNAEQIAMKFGIHTAIFLETNFYYATCPIHPKCYMKLYYKPESF